MRLPKWTWRIIRSRSTRRVLAISPFALMAGLAAWYGLMNLHADREMEKLAARVAAAGVPLSFVDYCSQGIAEDDDVFSHPAMADEMRARRLKGIHIRDLNIPDLAKRQPRSQPDLGVPHDVAAWFDPPPAGGEEVAARILLASQEPELEQLRKIGEALARPDAVWMENFDSSERPDFSRVLLMQGIARYALETGVFHLAAGDAQAAQTHGRIILDIMRAGLESRPTTLSLLISASANRNLGQLIWEGIVRGIWSEPQLADFEAKLLRLKPGAAHPESQKGEISLMTDLLIKSRSNGYPNDGFGLKYGWEAAPERIFARLRGLWWQLGPRGRRVIADVRSVGILLDESLQKGGAGCELTREDIERFDLISSAAPEIILANDNGDLSNDHPEFQAHSFLAYSGRSAVRMEAEIALLRTGIALERYRLKHGVHPAALADLVPSYLPAVPIDPWDEKPLRYQLQPDGSPLVWSVGRDGIDEGGRPNRDPDLGDPVWITRPIPGFTESDYRRR